MQSKREAYIFQLLSPNYELINKSEFRCLPLRQSPQIFGDHSVFLRDVRVVIQLLVPNIIEIPSHGGQTPPKFYKSISEVKLNLGDICFLIEGTK